LRVCELIERELVELERELENFRVYFGVLEIFVVIKWSGKDGILIEGKRSVFYIFFCKKINITQFYPLGSICKKIVNYPQGLK